MTMVSCYFFRQNLMTQSWHHILKHNWFQINKIHNEHKFQIFPKHLELLLLFLLCVKISNHIFVDYRIMVYISNHYNIMYISMSLCVDQTAMWRYPMISVDIQHHREENWYWQPISWHIQVSNMWLAFWSISTQIWSMHIG